MKPIHSPNKYSNMKLITLNDIIQEQLAKDPEFAEAYEKELIINAIARMIVKLRQTAHLTQSELAKKAHTTQPVIARLESGQDSRLPNCSPESPTLLMPNCRCCSNWKKNKISSCPQIFSTPVLRS